MTETQVLKFNSDDTVRKYLEMIAKPGEYVIYHNQLHKVVERERVMRLSVCGHKIGAKDYLDFMYKCTPLPKF